MDNARDQERHNRIWGSLTNRMWHPMQVEFNLRRLADWTEESGD